MRKDDARVLLAFDRDGTIVPYADRPDNAIMRDSTRRALNQLAERTDVFLCVVSARRVEFLRNDGLSKRVTLAGNYGLEIQFSDGSYFVHPKAREAAHSLQHLMPLLKKDLGSWYNLIFENHGFSLCVHWHLTPPNLRDELHGKMKRWKLEYSNLRFVRGLTSYEILPNFDWSKGNALDLIREQLELGSDGLFPVFFGDSSGDEEAFSWVNGLRGLSVRVGDCKRTNACRSFASVEAVVNYLQELSLSEATPTAIRALAAPYFQ